MLYRSVVIGLRHNPDGYSNCIDKMAFPAYMSYRLASLNNNKPHEKLYLDDKIYFTGGNAPEQLIYIAIMWADHQIPLPDSDSVSSKSNPTSLRSNSSRIGKSIDLAPTKKKSVVYPGQSIDYPCPSLIESLSLVMSNTR